MSAYASSVVAQIQSAFGAARDPGRADAMSAYMRGQFPFMGIPSPERALLERPVITGAGKPSASELVETAAGLWALPEREYQYTACGLLSKFAKALEPADLPAIRMFVTDKSWWDTVDTLASHVVGTMVANHPGLATEMDKWVQDDNMWVVRTAILHQLRYKTKTDTKRLFRYCDLQSGHEDFFIRKAIGWALREYSKSDADAVRAFVAEHEYTLSGLSKREALLWLNGGRKKKT